MAAYPKSPLILILFCWVNIAFGAENMLLKKSNIPVDLKVKARSVVRNNHEQLFVQDEKHATYKIAQTITILKLNGIDDAKLYIPLNKFSSLGSFSGSIYDAEGKVIEKVKKSDLADIPVVGGGTMYSDIHYLFFNPKQSKVPFTVTYEFEIDFNGVMNYPDWQAYPGYNIAVERNTFDVNYPADMSLRFYKMNNPPACQVDTIDKIIRHRWVANNLPAMHDEYLNPFMSDISPSVLVAPTNFQMKRFAGNAATWQNFGFFIKELNDQNENQLTAETKQKIQEITAQYPNPKERAKILYEFMQGKTRYVGIQEGIGYYQPIESESVDRLCYGDCKALSNYMKTILDEAGIKSYYALIRAGENTRKLIEEFPSNQFNHAIICIPFENDTIWLECTSQQAPFGYLGSFTDDRHALLITENGGVLIKTPAYNANHNRLVRSSKVHLDALGNAEATIKEEHHCWHYDDMKWTFYDDATEQKKAIIESIDIPNFLLRNYKLTEHRSEKPSIACELDIAINNLGTIVGNRLILSPNLMNRNENFLPDDERKTAIELHRAFSEYDTIHYILPQGYTLKSNPEPVILETKYGSYRSEIIKTAEGFKYHRLLVLYKGTYPSEEYTEFRAYFEKFSNADNAKIVLIQM